MAKGPSARPMPADFPAFIRANPIRVAMARYEANYSVLARWVRLAGLVDEVRNRRNIRAEMPADFADHAHRRREEIIAHYGRNYDHTTIARFRRECGVSFAKRGNGTAMAAVPEGFAVRVSNMSRIEAGRHYGVGTTVIERWAQESGASFRPWRRFASAGPIAHTPSADTSHVGQAAQHLRRTFVPVYDREKVEGKRFKDQWRVGGRTLSTADMVALAQAKGFVPWLEAA